MSTACIGLIVPPADDWLPPACAQLYPQVRFIARGLGISEMSAEGFARAPDLILERAGDLVRSGATVLSVMGTSLSFHRGAAFERSLVDGLAARTGRPVTSMSRAIVRALQANGAQRIAVATAYDEGLNRDLVAYLQAHGFAVTAIAGLDLTRIGDVRATAPEIVRERAREVFREDPTADAILISCGGLPTLDIHRALEQELGVPVVSSLPAALWDVMQTAGLDPRVSGFGRLFETVRAAQSARPPVEPTAMRMM
jgi:arylmalonate decarboxylase